MAHRTHAQDADDPRGLEQDTGELGEPSHWVFSMCIWITLSAAGQTEHVHQQTPAYTALFLTYEDSLTPSQFHFQLPLESGHLALV